MRGNITLHLLFVLIPAVGFECVTASAIFSLFSETGSWPACICIPRFCIAGSTFGSGGGDSVFTKRGDVCGIGG